jgi:type I restriction enzyme M protein
VTTPAFALAQILRNRAAHGQETSIDAVAAPLAWLLALRWAEAEDAEREAIADFNGEEYTRILPRDFAWDALLAGGVEGSELAESLWPRVRRALGLPDGREDLRQSPAGSDRDLVAGMAGWVRALPFATAADRRAAGDAFSELILRAAGGSRFVAEFTSPQTLGRMAVALAAPQPGERIYDPCCGTGSWLVGAAGEVWERGRRLSPGDWSRAQEVPLHGVEINPASHLVSFVRLMLAGFKPALELGDALERSAAGRHHEQGFDVVLANPPWGMSVRRSDVYDFPVRARTSEGYFLQHAAESLRPGGRAVVALPTAFLTRSGAEEEIRRWLLDSFRIDAVVNFPAGAFKMYRSVSVSLLAFRRASPATQFAVLDLDALPESIAGCRALAASIHSSRADQSTHALQRVWIENARMNASRLVVPTEDRSTYAVLQAIGEGVPLRELTDVADIRRGYRPKAGETLPDDVDVNSLNAERGAAADTTQAAAPVAFVRVSDLLGGRLQLGRRFLVPGIRRAGVVARDDILVSISGSIGKTAPADRVVWTGHPPDDVAACPPIASGDIALLRPRAEVDHAYLLAVLQSEAVQATLQSAATGAVIRHLSMKDIGNVSIPLPELPLQTRVVRHLRARGGGDALEVLAFLLRGGEEDALTRLLHEHAGVQRLLAGSVEEVAEDALVMEVLRAVNALGAPRNGVVEGAPADAQRWLTVVRMAAPVLFPDRGTTAGVVPPEAYDVAKMMLQAALTQIGDAESPAAREAVRLTKALMDWVPRGQARAARRYSFVVEDVGESSDGMGNGTAHVRVRLVGSAGLRSVLIGPVRGPQPVLDLGDVAPGDVRTLDLHLTEDMASARAEDTVSFDIELFWTALQWDGVEAEGSLPVEIRLAIARHEDAECGDREERDLGASPYITGDVVEGEEMFFGREDIIQRVLTQIGGGTKVVLLEGNRRSGKTSILRQICRPRYGLANQFVPVECSMQGTVGDDTRDGIPTERIFRMIVRDIGLACVRAGVAVPLPGMPPNPSPAEYRLLLVRALPAFFTGIDPYEALQIYVEMVLERIKPRRLLLMLDEFDKVQVGIDNGVTSPAVPENLRHLLQHSSGLTAIIAKGRQFDRLRKGYWSALFGFGYPVHVQPLYERDARALIEEPVRGRLRYQPAAVDRIVHETARQPFLVQSLCARVFEVCKDVERRIVTDEIVTEAIDRMVSDNEHFQALWNYAGSERRRYILCLCRDGGGENVSGVPYLWSRLEAARVPATMEEVADDVSFLVDLELLAMANSPAGAEYRLAIPMMGRWMSSTVDPGEVRRRAAAELSSGA